ncbi:unnamed protein product [Linum trigynum]|uniref:Uncharacterized protein n=1 Tax=Linum trigynum TaxID=586398 RepID=A0AAV2E685_9ROSI
MLPQDPHDVMAESTTFHELHLGKSNRFLMARLLNIWSECESDGTRSITSMHMLWLDKEGQLMEGNVPYEDSAHICKDIEIGCLYTMMNPTIIPARSERRTAPSNLRLYFTKESSFKAMIEYRSIMHFPDDYFFQSPFNGSGSSTSPPPCFSDITGCVTHITEPAKVNSDTSMFQIYFEDMSGNKALVSYIGTRIKDFIESATAKEVHYPLVVTATALTRNMHEYDHIPQFCFVTSPGSRLIVHSYNEMTKDLMNRFFPNRLPVDIIDYKSKERLGYLRRDIPPRISLLELTNKLPLGEEETEILYRCKLKIVKFDLGSVTREVFPGDTELFYELQAECESGNHKAKVILNHGPTLALLRKPPIEFKKMPYDKRVQMQKECCNIKFMAEVYIIGSEYEVEPQIRMFAIWHPKAFQPLLDLKLNL